MAAETLSFPCTTCPKECTLSVAVEDDGDVRRCISCTGNRCPRGKAFAEQEVSDPVRILATTVAVSNGEEHLLPARTREAIPLRLHAQAMALIRPLTARAPINMGDVILPNILDTGTDLIASMDVESN